MVAFAAVVAVVTGCDSGGATRTAIAICAASVPGWRSASSTSVSYIRHFKTSNLQPVSPFVHAFGTAPDNAAAAWCWTEPRSHTFRAYAATVGHRPIMIAELSGPSMKLPKGAPTIV